MINSADKYMLSDIENIMVNGFKDENPRPKYADGTPAHTLSVNHVIRQYDLTIATKEYGCFPICTLRPIAWKSAIKEILWIYQDQSNSLDMLNNKYNVHYWNDWESKDIPNTIGVRYGATVKKHNLINKLLDGLINDPYGRRHIMSLWQEEDFKESDGLVPCAFLTQFNVRKVVNTTYLDMVLYQRSGDMLAASGAGGINEVQYMALQMMIARHCGYNVGKFTHFIANEQIYDRHTNQATEMMHRATTSKVDMNIQLILNPEKKNFFDFTIDDFTLVGYEPIKPQLKLDLGI